MKLIPCRICEGAPEPKKCARMTHVPDMKKYKRMRALYAPGMFYMPEKPIQRGRLTWYECDCGIKGKKSACGTKDARVLWNEENLDVHLRRLAMK